MVLSGLRGVGKTVLLNALRGQAVKRAWGTGKIEARPDQSLRHPARAGGHAAVREVAHRHRDPDRVDEVAGRAQGVRAAHRARRTARACGGQPPIDVAAAKRPRRLRRPRARPHRAVHRRRRLWPATSASASPSSSTRCRTSRPRSSPRSAAPATRSASRASPLLVVGAGLPHLPVALAASKSYAERLFRYVVVDRLPREMAERAWTLPASTEEGVTFDAEALDELYRADRRLSLLRPGLRQGHLGRRRGEPDPARRRHGGRARGRGRAGGRLLRRPLRPGHSGRARLHAHDGRPRRRRRRRRYRPPTSPGTSSRKPQSLSPARDGLIKKGLVFSAERGTVAFTVPHFGQFLRSQR